MVLPDYLTVGLRVVFVGTAAAEASAARMHYYAGPGNKFYEYLTDSGLTNGERLRPEDDVRLNEFGIGLTDLVKGRPASSDSDLRPADFDIAGFVDKMTSFAPVVVAFNGKTAADKVSKKLRLGDAALGPAAWQIGSSKVFVLPSSSGSLCTSAHWAPKEFKADWWRELGGFVGVTAG